MSKDRMDALGVGWHDTTAQKGESCKVCGASLRHGIRILAERVLIGVNVHPHTLHRRCWPKHLNLTVREAASRKKAKEQEKIDTAAAEG